MNLAAWLARTALAAPGAPATALGDRVAADYRTLAHDAARIAGGLLALGLRPGDRVGLAMKNAPEYLAAIYGIWWAGCVAVPMNAKLHGAELGWIIGNAEARVCLANGGLDAEIAPHAPACLERLVATGSAAWRALLSADPVPVARVEGDDLAWLFYTSGTTGRPKGAMLTHRVLSWATHAYLSEVDAVPPGGAILHAAPLSHGSGLYMMAHVLRGGVQVVPDSGGFEPDEVFSLFARWRGAGMFAAPTMIKRLVASPADCDPSAIRTLVWGGAPMYVADAKAALDRFGPCLAQIYGQGEAPMTITTLTKAEIADRGHPDWDARLASAGRPYGCVEVAVVDADDRPLPVGEAGEVIARGDVVMPGYWRNPEANATAMRGGWLHTGDVGSFDAAGYLTLKDRSKDLVISGGANIYPREVEEVLLTHPAVRECSVIGRPDPEWGEVVVAYVVGEVAPADLDALCLARIARFKRPKDYVFVDALPKNAYGKILKTDLRARDAARGAPDPG